MTFDSVTLRRSWGSDRTRPQPALTGASPADAHRIEPAPYLLWWARSFTSRRTYVLVGPGHG